MTKLHVDKTKDNVISHMADITGKINSPVSRLEPAVEETKKILSYLLSEAQVNEIVDADDVNRALDLIQIQADTYAAISADLTSLAGLKGVDDSATAANLTQLQSDIAYNHGEYSKNFA